MAKIQYQQKKFLTKSIDIIDKANDIIAEFEKEGYTLTLRQLYYQFIAKALFPNTERSYKRLISIINDARIAGLIDWNSIEDRTRNLQGFNHYDDPADFLMQKVNSYHINTREGQKIYLEVWVEKDALVGIIEKVCQKYDVYYFACRGYVSQSEQHSAALRIGRTLRSHEKAIVLHLGDHDPSGIDMTRDIEDRMKMFLGHYNMGQKFKIQRLALNMAQVRKYRPPNNPAKVTDSRFTGYEAEHGDKSWELDSLKPQVIAKLIEDAIVEHTDLPRWKKRTKLQAEGREQLTDAAHQFERDNE